MVLDGKVCDSIEAMNHRAGYLTSSATMSSVSRVALSLRTLCSLLVWAGTVSAQEIDRGPYLQQGGATSMVLRWRTTEPTETRLEYRSNPDSRVMVYQSSVLTTDHEVKLNDLLPQTRYHYAIAANSKVLAGGDADHFFVTSPKDGDEPVRVWILGDAGSSGLLEKGEEPAQAAVRDAFLKRHTLGDFDFIMMLGDNAYNVGTDQQYQRGFFQPYRSVLRSKVTWPTQGNHDHTTKAYYPVFTLPTRGESGGVPSGTEHYYSFEHGNAHFISLNSEVPDSAFRTAMISWLRKDLAARNKPWTIVFWHHPPYSKGHHDSDDLKDSGGRMAWMRERIVPILDDAGVDMVFTGHSHSYERSKFITRYYGTSQEFADSYLAGPGNGRDDENQAYTKKHLSKSPHSGTVFVTAGSAGWVEPGPFNHAAMVVSTATLGSILLSIDGNEAGATMIGADGNTVDSFTLRKEPERPRAVRGLAATVDEQECQVSLSWSKDSSDLSYTVYRSVFPDARGSGIGDVRDGTSRFVDIAAPSAGGSLYYSVRAANRRGKGPWGSAVVVSSLPASCSSRKLTTKR